MPIILFYIIGILIRILFYSYNRPFWNDECALALNITDSWNYFHTLTYNQAAPPLFMLLSKICYYLTPHKELALRFIPLVSSIASLFVFHYLCKKLFTKNITKYTALTLFAFCYPLCYYAQEFKQYSSDVLIFLLILASYFAIDKFKNIKQILTYGLLCAISIWFSFTAIFGLFGVFVTTFLCKRDKFIRLIPATIPVVVSFILFYFYSQNLQNNEYLHQYWNDSFINQGLVAFWDLLKMNTKYIFRRSLPLFIIIISILTMLIKDRKSPTLLLGFSPIVLALGLSYLSVYPFSTRIILFLIPSCIFLCAKIFDYINIKNKITSYTVSILLLIMLVLPVIRENIKNIWFKNYTYEDISTPLKTAVAFARPQDVIYISEDNHILYEYYKSTFNIQSQVIIETTNIQNDSEYIANLEKLPRRKTYYWVYAHHLNKKKRLEAVYSWAKNQKNFRGYYDKKGNTLLIFTR